MISCPCCKEPPLRKDGSCPCGRTHVPPDGPAVFFPDGQGPLECTFLISVRDGMVIVVDCRPGGPGVVTDPEDPGPHVEEALLLASATEVLQS